MMGTDSKALPSCLIQGISSIRWPLDEDAHVPLYLKPFDEMRYIRQTTHFLPTCMWHGSTCPCFDESSNFQEFLAHMPESFEQLLPQEYNESRQFGLVAMALILIGNGFTDEAHSLVAPISYPQELPFSYGPSVYSRVSEEARAYASYVHSLVHRREGNNVGEFGMKGFANASYWSSIVIRSPGVESLPSADLRRHVATLAESYSKCPAVQEWYTRHQLNEHMEDPYFEARVVHEICATVVNNHDCDPVLRQFAEQVVETEVRVLLLHALQRAGFQVDASQILKRSSSPDTSS